MGSLSIITVISSAAFVVAMIASTGTAVWAHGTIADNEPPLGKLNAFFRL